MNKESFYKAVNDKLGMTREEFKDILNNHLLNPTEQSREQIRNIEKTLHSEIAECRRVVNEKEDKKKKIDRNVLFEKLLVRVLGRLDIPKKVDTEVFQIGSNVLFTRGEDKKVVKGKLKNIEIEREVYANNSISYKTVLVIDDINHVEHRLYPDYTKIKKV